MPPGAWEAIIRTWGITGVIVAGGVITVQQVVKIVLTAWYQPHVMAARDAWRREREYRKRNPNLPWREMVLRGASIQWDWVGDDGEWLLALKAATCSACSAPVPLETLYGRAPHVCGCAAQVGPFSGADEMRFEIVAAARRKFPPQRYPHLVFSLRDPNPPEVHLEGY